MGTYVRMLAYSSRTHEPISPNLHCLHLGTRTAFQNGQQFDSVLISSTGDGGFCSLETKSYRKMAPRAKLFV